MGLTIFSLANRYSGDAYQVEDYSFFAARFVFIFVASSVTGYLYGVGIAYLYKVLSFNDSHDTSAIGLLICAVYMSFLCSELLHLSGVVSILFTGIAIRRYVNKNLSNLTNKSTSAIVGCISHVSVRTF